MAERELFERFRVAEEDMMSKWCRMRKGRGNEKNICKIVGLGENWRLRHGRVIIGIGHWIWSGNGRRIQRAFLVRV
jgi:hypothetical protein